MVSFRGVGWGGEKGWGRMPSLRPATPAFWGVQGLTLNWAGLPQSAERSARAATKARPGSAESKVGLSFGFKTKRKNIVSRAASTELETRERTKGLGSGGPGDDRGQQRGPGRVLRRLRFGVARRFPASADFPPSQYKTHTLRQHTLFWPRIPPSKHKYAGGGVEDGCWTREGCGARALWPAPRGAPRPGFTLSCGHQSGQRVSPDREGRPGAPRRPPTNGGGS